MKGLVVSRRAGESIRIGRDIVIEIISVSPSKVRLTVIAPPNVLVLRDELEEWATGPPPRGSGQEETGSMADTD